MTEFIHLRLHSEYSLSDSLIRIKPLVNQLAQLKYPACAVTDQSNLCSVLKFYQAAVAKGIKPIIGCDIYLQSPDPKGSPSKLVLLVQNEQGYKNLTKLVSDSYLMDRQQGLPVVNRSQLWGLNQGLIVLSGGLHGELGQYLINDQPDKVQNLLESYQNFFKDRFYIELQRTGRAQEENYLHQAVSLARENGLPVVATNDVCFIHSDDFEAHEARVCINQGRTLSDPRRAKNYSEKQYLTSVDEMKELFRDIPEALENTVEIAKRCNCEIELGKSYLPTYEVPKGKTIDEYFTDLANEGLKKRLAFIEQQSGKIDVKKYQDRLDFELKVIIQMKFPGYFLIVMDFIKWAKDNGIPVGPGRGSGAGSIVAYALEITDIDPLKYDLLFERFLNPERVSMPDFDVDFCMEGRDKVINYVSQRYGKEAVSQIITFGTMAAKAVVRDVARVQGKAYGLADRLSKMIPFEVGMTLSKAVEQEEPLREFIETDEEVQEIMEMAYKLEGVARNVGKHAGGVVIAPTRLTDFAPLYRDELGSGIMTQFDKDDVEQAGLVKFDFLGLRTLTIINWAVELINKKMEASNEPPLDISRIPLDDESTYQLVKAGRTTAVFQLESRGIKELMQRLKPDTFEDIVALVALFRPGPLQSGMADEFINRKHGRKKVEYQHSDLEPVLKTTYGVILYQEQVMKIAQNLAGYSLGQADILRKAMGKKKPEEMAKQRKIFTDGAVGRGVDETVATQIFDIMEKFAGYGFNKSHSVAYAYVSYQTAWLKNHYPAPFMAAVLSADMQNTDKVVTLIEECREFNIPIAPPNVNIGQFKFTVNSKNEIIYGLGAIKGVGEGPIEAIVNARQEGAFADLFDFCIRIDNSKVNHRTLDALIKAGALDCLVEETKGYRRAMLLEALEEALKAANQTAHNEALGMEDLFGGLVPNEQSQGYQEYYSVRDWSVAKRLQYEKEVLGLFLTGHPIDQYKEELQFMTKRKICDLQDSKSNQVVAGLIVSMRVTKSKRGEQLGFLVLDDRTGRIEVGLFGEIYDQYKEKLVKDELVVVEGQVSQDDYTQGLKMTVKKVYDLIEARTFYASHILLQLRSDQLNTEFTKELMSMLKPHCQGACPIVIHYQNDIAQAQLALGEEWKVKPSDELIARLRDQYGSHAVQLEYVQ